ncbi:unnamed protein product, partial [Polarella glacialis]
MYYIGDANLTFPAADHGRKSSLAQPALRAISLSFLFLSLSLWLLVILIIVIVVVVIVLIVIVVVVVDWSLLAQELRPSGRLAGQGSMSRTTVEFGLLLLLLL